MLKNRPRMPLRPVMNDIPQKVHRSAACLLRLSLEEVMRHELDAVVQPIRRNQCLRALLNCWLVLHDELQLRSGFRDGNGAVAHAATDVDDEAFADRCPWVALDDFVDEIALGQRADEMTELLVLVWILRFAAEEGVAEGEREGRLVGAERSWPFLERFEGFCAHGEEFLDAHVQARL